MAPQPFGRGAMMFVHHGKEKTMNINDKQLSRPAMQVLITAASGFDTAPNCYWLHGFCLLTCRRSAEGVSVTGKLMTGERFADDAPLIRALSRELDDQAVLVGLDLTDMVGRLGRLPTDAEDQKPALALLARLRAMLVANDPIDLALTDLSRSWLVASARENGLHLAEPWEGGEQSLCAPSGVGIDDLNPTRLATDLVNTAGACLLAAAELRHRDNHTSVAAAWRRWRSDLLIAPAMFGSPWRVDPN